MTQDTGPNKVNDGGVDRMPQVSVWSRRHQSPFCWISRGMKTPPAKGESGPEHEERCGNLHGDRDSPRTKYRVLVGKNGQCDNGSGQTDS